MNGIESDPGRVGDAVNPAPSTGGRIPPVPLGRTGDRAGPGDRAAEPRWLAEVRLRAARRVLWLRHLWSQPRYARRAAAGDQPQRGRPGARAAGRDGRGRAGLLPLRRARGGGVRADRRARRAARAMPASGTWSPRFGLSRGRRGPAHPRGRGRRGPGHRPGVRVPARPDRSRPTRRPRWPRRCSSSAASRRRARTPRSCDGGSPGRWWPDATPSPGRPAGGRTRHAPRWRGADGERRPRRRPTGRAARAAASSRPPPGPVLRPRGTGGDRRLRPEARRGRRARPIEIELVGAPGSGRTTLRRAGRGRGSEPGSWRWTRRRSPPGADAAGRRDPGGPPGAAGRLGPGLGARRGPATAELWRAIPAAPLTFLSVPGPRGRHRRTAGYRSIRRSVRCGPIARRDRLRLWSSLTAAPAPAPVAEWALRPAEIRVAAPRRARRRATRSARSAGGC